MDYKLDRDKFKKRLVEAGYRGVSDLGKRGRLHRNTLQNLLHGQAVFSASFRRLALTLKADPLELIQPTSLSGRESMSEISEVVGALISRDKGLAVILLGSRASGRAKRYSDWDLGLFRYPEPISGREFLRLKGEVSDLTENLPRFVDLVNLHQAPPWFLGELGKVKLLDGNSQAFTYFLGVLDGVGKQKAA